MKQHCAGGAHKEKLSNLKKQEAVGPRNAAAKRAQLAHTALPYHEQHCNAIIPEVLLKDITPSLSRDCVQFTAQLTRARQH